MGIRVIIADQQMGYSKAWTVQAFSLSDVVETLKPICNQQWGIREWGKKKDVISQKMKKN